MKFLVDQDVWKDTVDLLRSLGHDVVTASEIGLATASDEQILRKAAKEGRIFVTRDKDFGSLVFLSGIPTKGVIFIRIEPRNKDQVYAQLRTVLDVHGEDELRGCFCTVEAGRHRLRVVPS